VILLALLAFRLLLRSDGLVDRTTKFGTVDKTLQAPNGVPYVAINTQFCGSASENDDGANIANYLVRIDGVVDRFLWTRGSIENQIPPPPPTKYISASAMQTACELSIRVSPTFRQLVRSLSLSIVYAVTALRTAFVLVWANPTNARVARDDLSPRIICPHYHFLK
jgi:hypothetical protein